MVIGLSIPPKQDAPVEAEKKGGKAGSWIVGIIILVALSLALYWFMTPPASKTEAEMATTTEDGTQEPASTQGASKPASSSQTKPATQGSSYPGAGTRLFENGVYVTVAHFDGKKFNPETLTISSGEEVRFINTSNLTMDVGAQLGAASSPAYNSYNQATAVGRGGTFQLSFTQPGIFSYENKTSNPSVKGTIFVK